MINIEKTIREYFPDIVHMSLATCGKAMKPWVCEVHFVYDNDLNLYFKSNADRRHSLEIAKNSNVAGNIVTQHSLGDKPRGVYFEGTAEKLKKVDENHIAYKLFCERLGAGPGILNKDDPDKGHGFYKITVSDYYVFDARESKPSQKYHLQWKKS